MKEIFEAYMRYGDLAIEMMDSASGMPQYALSEKDLDELIERYEWFNVARILKVRLTGELDYQTKILLATGRCPFTLVKPTADIVGVGKQSPTTGVPSPKPQQRVAVEQREVSTTDVVASEQSASTKQPQEIVVDAAQTVAQGQIQEPVTGQTQQVQSAQANDIEQIREAPPALNATMEQTQDEVKAQGQGSEQSCDAAAGQTQDSEQSPTDGGKNTISMIDDFLSLEGDQLKIRPDDKTTAEDISINSMVTELDIVSEELAEIYLNQGYKITAIEIYRKLSLLNPEKSVYFAELIEKIK